MILSLRGFVGFWSLQALTHLHEKNVIYRVWKPGMLKRGLTAIHWYCCCDYVHPWIPGNAVALPPGAPVNP